MSRKHKYSLGNIVVLNKNREGIVRYVGPVKGHKGTFYGIELTKGKGDNNGSIESKKYFTCTRNKGKFVPAVSIVRKKKAKKRSNSIQKAPPRKKRKLLLSSSPSTSPQTSDNEEDRDYNSPLNENKQKDEYQVVLPSNSRKRKRKRSHKTYKRDRDCSSDSNSKVSIRCKSKKYHDPFETNEEEEHTAEGSNNEDEDNLQNNYGMNVEHDEDIENVDAMDLDHDDDDNDDDTDDATSYEIELESINNEIESFTVNKLKYCLKSLQLITSKENEAIFSDISLKGRKKELIKKIKEKLLCVYAKNLKNKSKKHYTNAQFKEWKEQIEEFITNAKDLKSPTKSAKTKRYSYASIVENDDVYDVNHSDNEKTPQSATSRAASSQVLTGRRSTRLQSKSKPNYIESHSSDHVNSAADDGDNDAGLSQMTQYKGINMNAPNLQMTTATDEIKTPKKNTDAMKADEVQMIHDENEDNEEDENNLSIDMILKGLSRLKQVNENKMKKKEDEIKEKDVKIKEFMKEIKEMKEKYDKEIQIKEEKLTKLSEKNKKRKQELFVLKRKNEIHQKTIEENEEAIEDKDSMIQEKEEENKKLKKLQKENKHLITQQQNEITELNIYKELYDKDQDESLTQIDE